MGNTLSYSLAKLKIVYKSSLTSLSGKIPFCSRVPGSASTLKSTYCGLMTPYRIKDLGQHRLRWWLLAWGHQVITWTNLDLSLTHLPLLPLVPHIHISELGQHCFRLWLAISSAPSHYLNQCLVIGLLETNCNKIWMGILSFPLKKCTWNCCLPKWWPFCPWGR